MQGVQYLKWKASIIYYVLHCPFTLAGFFLQQRELCRMEEEQVTDPLHGIVLKRLKQSVIWNALGDCERPNLLIETLVVAFDRGVNWNALK